MGAGCSSGNQVHVVNVNDNHKRHVSICGFAPQLTVVAEMHEAETADFRERRREYLRRNREGRAGSGGDRNSPGDRTSPMDSSIPVLVLPPPPLDPQSLLVRPDAIQFPVHTPPASPSGTRLQNPFHPSQLHSPRLHSF